LTLGAIRVISHKVGGLSKEVEDELFSLPVEERARLADRLLVSLSPETDMQWFGKLDVEMAARREARKNGGIEVRDGISYWENISKRK